MATNIKEHIKQSALELFNTAGYEATSIRDLSAKAECSLPMMYYYYESKEKLLKEIVTVDFTQAFDSAFIKALKTNDLKQFIITFATEVGAFTEEQKKASKIALKLHMGSPKNDELNKFISSYKFNKETQLKNLLLTTWRGDNRIEVKTHFTFALIYNFIVDSLLTNRPISLKQLESDISFLL